MSTSELEEQRRERLLSVRRELPPLGLGTWQIPDGPECLDAVRWALELGYRHIDTAQAYGNETSVGRALRESRVARDEVFVTTKFYPRRRDRSIGSSNERRGDRMRRSSDRRLLLHPGNRTG